MRVANRIIAVIVALLLLLLGLLVAIEIFLAAIGQGPWIIPHDDWFQDARQNPWESGAVRAILIVMGVVGLILLVLQLIRRRPTALPLRPVPGGGDTAISRTALERSLARAAEGVDLVSGAKARVSDRKAHVVVRTPRRQPGDLGARVAGAVRERIENMQLAYPPAVSVRVRTREG